MNRKNFLKLAGLTTTVGLVSSAGLSQPIDKAKGKKTTDLHLGLASYTLRKLSLDDVIKVAQRLDLKGIALKSMHMPLDAPAEQIKAAAEKVRAAGLKLYGAGVIYMKTAQEVDNAFTYAKTAGLETIIGVPNHEFLPQVNELVKKHDIRLAIHNHGPGDDLYRSPNNVFDKIKDLDKRIGLCIDIGHVVRIGEDPIALIKKYKDRLYDMHMKDVNKVAEDGTPLEIGRGVIDIPGVINALKSINYSNQVAIEYEKDGDDPVPGLAESVGYLRGVMKLSS
jgi:inosose dehydratase